MQAGSLCSGLSASQNSLFYLNLFLLLPVLKPLPVFIFVSLPETLALSALFVSPRDGHNNCRHSSDPLCLAGVRRSYIAFRVNYTHPLRYSCQSDI